MTSHHPIPSSTGQAMLGRRAMLFAATLVTFPIYAFLQEVRAADTLINRHLSAKRWIDRQEELARALRSGAISHLAWHDAVNRMASEVDITELMAQVSHTSARPGTPFMGDPIKRRIRFLDEQGQPRHLSYGAATFSFGPENVITPHAHAHMVSAHMVVEGQIRIRTFDRVSTEDGAIVIRPTGDHIGNPGSAAAMTTEKDNVHWFTPVKTPATTFDVIVDGLDPGQKDYVIQPIDPLRGMHRPDGTIVAPLLSFEESMQRYSAHV